MGGLQHFQVDVRALMAGETDIADFPGFFCGQYRFQRAAGTEYLFRVGHADDFMELQQVDGLGLQPSHRFFKLLICSFGGMGVDFGHQEDFIAVAVLQRFPHSDFTGAFVVIPAIVHESNAVINGIAHYPDTFIFAYPGADVKSAQTDSGHFLTGAAQDAQRYFGIWSCFHITTFNLCLYFVYFEENQSIEPSYKSLGLSTSLTQVIHCLCKFECDKVKVLY